MKKKPAKNKQINWRKALKKSKEIKRKQDALKIRQLIDDLYYLIHKYDYTII